MYIACGAAEISGQTYVFGCCEKSQTHHSSIFFCGWWLLKVHAQPEIHLVGLALVGSQCTHALLLYVNIA